MIERSESEATHTSVTWQSQSYAGFMNSFQTNTDTTMIVETLLLYTLLITLARYSSEANIPPFYILLSMTE